MPHDAWLLVAVLLFIPTVVVVWLKMVLRKEESTICGTGGCLFAFLCPGTALWVIHDKLS